MFLLCAEPTTARRWRTGPTPLPNPPPQGGRGSSFVSASKLPPPSMEEAEIGPWAQWGRVSRSKGGGVFRFVGTQRRGTFHENLIPLELTEEVHGVAGGADLGASAEIGQIDDEGTADEVAAHLFDELDRR